MSLEVSDNANAMLRIVAYTTVRVAKLRHDVDHTSTSSSFSARPQPAVGDLGVVIDRTPDGGLYWVESVNADGKTFWLSTFAEDELEVV